MKHFFHKKIVVFFLLRLFMVSLIIEPALLHAGASQPRSTVIECVRVKITTGGE